MEGRISENGFQEPSHKVEFGQAASKGKDDESKMDCGAPANGQLDVYAQLLNAKPNTSTLIKGSYSCVNSEGPSDTCTGEPVDLYSPDLVPTGPVDFWVRDFSAGDHKLTVEITCANGKAEKAYMLGLDYLMLEGQ